MLKPWEFHTLTPRQFFLLWDGYEKRRSDAEETAAHFVAVLANYSGHAKQTVTAESVLGRPLRANWKAALAKKDQARKAKGR